MSATVQGGGQPPDPPVGLLSRTVFPSPIVERILTGRIRHSRYVDAIFVSRGSVVVKERGHDGQFSNIAFTSNFGSPVVAADIVGKRVRRPRDADVDHPKVKLEALDLKMDQCALQPSHKLVLLLEAGELLFLTMTRDGTHAWTFDHVRQSLPPAADALQDWRFLAVHPDSHAMAVSSWSGHVAVLTFSDSLQIRSTLYFDSGITILLMDFLYSSADDSTVYLMLVGRKDDRFRILVYSWDPQQPLTPVLPYRYNLDWRHPIPNLLIPLANTPGGFVLGALQQLSLYSNAHVGSIQKSVEYTDVPVFTPEPSQNPESSFEHPLWTNWARASRWFTNSDCLYLIREDGVVYNVEVGTELESVKNYNGHVLEGLDFVRSGQPTCLRGNIASAFALYQPEEDNDDGPDVLLFAGDLSDGAHYEIGQTQPHAGDDPMIIVLAPQQKEIFYNWAPFLDVAVVPPQRRSREISRHAYKSRPEDHLNDRSRVFATSGKGSWGAVCELRMGREFIVDSTLELEDMLKGANTAWSIHNTSADWRFDFVSTPFQTVVINWLRQEIEPQQLCDTPTLAVGLLKPFGKTDFIREFILQVTTSSITLLKVQLRLEDEGEPLHTLCVVQSWQQTSVLAAMDVSTGLIVLATRRGDDMFLSLKQIQHIDDDDWQLSQLGESLLCNHDPTCISIFSFPAHSAVIKQEEGVPASQPLQFVAFGTNVGEIAISRIDSIGLGPLKYYILCGETASEMASETACESLCVVSNPESPDCQLICGLRNGALIIGRLLIEDTVARLDLGSTTNFYMGSTSPSLKITADSHGLGCFVYGGVDTCYLDFGHGRTEGMTLSNVWITNRADRSLNQPPMGAICLINDQTGQSDQPSRVLCLSIHGRGYFGVLGKAVEPLPRRIPVSGTPNRLIYSSFLQCLIVASTVVINDNATHTRFETSRITLVDPNGEAQDADSMDIDGDNAPSNSTYRELPDVSERITSLAEWMCTKGDSKHHFLVVGTTAETKEGVYGGVIRLFQVRSNDNGDREIRSLKSSKESKPVGAVCALDDRTLLYSAGDEIRKRTLTFESDIE
ncbi:hypothetical protein FH972_021181 [Carpinus fangiana]|uniref:Uncharacterized protein n=1 Tax=Carpinus fangiana TaxID=176857 RepID=A0A5N6KNZ5_9ROSI|nr:hypothetical protein FH972_021181 [Carpinus fangiana]